MYQYRCKINKVLDGDTVDVDLDLGFNIMLVNQRVRMTGIDTPESRTADQEEKVRGILSKKKLAEKLPLGAWVRINTSKSDNNDDKFGRILGEFILSDNSNVNLWMIDNNYAVAYAGENKALTQEKHAANKKLLIERGEL